MRVVLCSLVLVGTAVSAYTAAPYTSFLLGRKTTTTTRIRREPMPWPSQQVARTRIRLAAKGEGEEVQGGEAGGVSEEAPESDAAATATEEEEEEEEEKEDPELTALKQEISKLEEELKVKKLTLDSVLKQGERYTKEGYARKVAEIDQIRRLQTSSRQASGFVQRAVVLQSFLPVLDKLTELNTVTYADNDFAQSSYSALLNAFFSALRELDATEYSAGEAGTPVDRQRVQVVRDEYSDQFPKGTVLEALADGLEVGTGSIIRMAQCVASLGPEGGEEEEEEETEQGDADGDESEPEAEEDASPTTEEEEE